MYVFTSVYFLWTRYEIIHLCVAFVSVFFLDPKIPHLLSPLHFLRTVSPFLAHWSLILSMAEVSISMLLPASIAVPSPAWLRFRSCEGGSFLWLVWIDCVFKQLIIPSLSKIVFRFSCSRSGLFSCDSL